MSMEGPKAWLLQDILEEVFGEFRDDVENSSIAFQRIDDKNYVLRPKLLLVISLKLYLSKSPIC